MDRDPGKRHAMRFDLAFSVVIESPWGISQCVARNISAGGIFLETNESYPIGTRLWITFELHEGDETIIALAEVKHIVRFFYNSKEGESRMMRGVGTKFIEFADNGVAPHLRLAPL